jgi:hypothetical protein
MDNFCYLCNKIIDDNYISVLCDSHIERLATRLIGIEAIAIGPSNNSVYYSCEEDVAPFTRVFKSITHFVDFKNVEFITDEDFAYGRCTVLFVEPAYELTQDDFILLDDYANQYKPIIVYQTKKPNTSSTCRSIQKKTEWILMEGSPISIDFICEYYDQEIPFSVLYLSIP